MTKEDFIKEHEEYCDIDLSANEMNKLRGLPMPGAKVLLYWQDENKKPLCRDIGYLFLTPFQDEDIDDYFIHVPRPDNQCGKENCEPEWAHINKLLKNKMLEKIVIIQEDN